MRGFASCNQAGPAPGIAWLAKTQMYLVYALLRPERF